MGVLEPADAHEGRPVLAHQIQAGVLGEGAGEDHAVDLVGGQLAAQLVGVLVVGEAHEHVVAPLGRHAAHPAHALAQEGQVQAHKVGGDHQGQIVGEAPLQRAGGGAGLVAGVVDKLVDPLSGPRADAPLPGEGPGHSGLGHPQLLGDAPHRQLALFPLVHRTNPSLWMVASRQKAAHCAARNPCRAAQ